MPSPAFAVHAVKISFGDGQRASGRSVFEHRYARAGVYTVVVQVRDNVATWALFAGW